MSETNTAIQPVPDKVIQEASAEELRAVDVYKSLLPYGGKLTDQNALTLHLFSKRYDLDPFLGECWFLVKEKKDDRGNVIQREEMGCMPGIKGKRKKAREQIEAQDPHGTYALDYKTVDPKEVGLGQDKKVFMVVRAELRDSVSNGKYIVDLLQLKKEGFTKEEIANILGKPPRWTGYGIVKQFELRYIKQTPYDLARKRAESQATSQRFSLPFADAVEDVYVNGDVTHTYDDVPQIEYKDADPEDSQLLSREAEILISEKICENKFSANNLLKHFYEHIGNATFSDEYLINWGKLYRAWRDVDMDTEHAVEQANAGNVPGEQQELPLE